LPLEEDETVPDAIVRHIFMGESDDPDHTCFIVGGNRENIDEMTYQVIPLLSAYVKLI